MKTTTQVLFGLAFGAAGAMVVIAGLKWAAEMAMRVTP